MTDTINNPEAIQLADQARGILAQAAAVSITNVEQYTGVADQLKIIKAKQKEVDGMRVKMKAPALETCRQIDAFFKGPLDFLSDAEKSYKTAMVAFDNEQERMRREQQRKVDEAARKEREMLEQKAREAREKAEREAAELRRQAEAAAAAGRAEEAAKLASKATKTIDKADAKAEGLEQSAMQVVTPTVVMDAPKVSGITKRVVWFARVVNPNLLPREYLVPNEKALDGIAKATKGEIQIPGVEFYSENLIASGSK